MSVRRERLRSIVSYLCLTPTLLILCTPLVINSTIPHSIVGGQTFWVYLLLPIATITTFLSYIINRKNINFSVIDFLISFFLLSGVFTTWIVTRELNYKTDISILILCLYFQTRIIIVQKKPTVNILSITFITIGLIEAIWGLMQISGVVLSQHSLSTATGSFFNPGPYAGFLSIVAPATLYFCLEYKQLFKVRISHLNYKRYIILILSAITLILILVALPLTMSRASWVAAFFGCACIIFCNNSVKPFFKRNLKKVYLLFLLGLFILSFLLYGLYSIKQDSADGRKLIWKNTISLIQNNPWGVGLNHFSGKYGDCQAEYFQSGLGSKQEEMIAGSPNYAFNEYLQICAEYGIIPFLGFLSIVIYSIITAVRRKRIAALGAIIALYTFASMSYPFSLMPFILLWIFLTIICTYSSPLEGKRVSPIFILLLVSIILSTTYISYKKISSYQAFKNWSTAKALYVTKSYNLAHKQYQPLYPYLKDHHDFLFEYGQILSNIEQYGESNKVLEEACKISCDPMLYNIIGINYQNLEDFFDAERYFIKASNIIPHRLYPYYLLTKMYIKQGKTEEAKQAAKLLLEKEEKISSPATNSMKAEAKDFLDGY